MPAQPTGRSTLRIRNTERGKLAGHHAPGTMHHALHRRAALSVALGLSFGSSMRHVVSVLDNLLCKLLINFMTGTPAPIGRPKHFELSISCGGQKPEPQPSRFPPAGARARELLNTISGII